MTGKERPCSSGMKNTNYICLTCSEYFCTPCSIFENDEEDVADWKAGVLVAYCELCFREKMEREIDEGATSSGSGEQPPKKQREAKR